MDTYLKHHGIKGQKWGSRNGPPYPLKSSARSAAEKRAASGSKETVFVSGSSKTEDPSSEWHLKRLPKETRSYLDKSMRNGEKIIVGDAPGIDRQVQNYLNDKGYSNVEVYGPGKQVRYTANKKWKTNPIDDPDHEEYSKEWLAKKDIAMTEAATKGLAIPIEGGASATRKNVERMVEQGKDVTVQELRHDYVQAGKLYVYSILRKGN